MSSNAKENHCHWQRFWWIGCAARLAAHGHDVEVFEKRDKLGGRAYVYEIDGFKFDGGPTVITAPWLFDEVWAEAGKRREEYFTFKPVDPFYRIFDAQGTSVQLQRRP
jgi:phytoene desaturase